MKLTRNGKLFALVSIITTGLFFTGLDYYGNQTGDRSGSAMLLAALLAVFILLAAARLLLHYENERQHKVNLHVAYHFIALVAAAGGWVVAYVLSDYVQPIDLAWIAAVGGGSLMAHWLLVRNRTKGIDAKKAFL